MEKLLIQLKTFFEKNAPVIIVNTSTDKALLCLRPAFTIKNDLIFMQFESLNERDGNSVFFKKLQGFDTNKLFLENECDNVLMVQSLNLTNYRHYIQTQYANAPAFDDLTKLKTYIKKQK